jgi:GNAT superfamily N-acetyltransferase
MNVRKANVNDIYQVSKLWLKLGYEINPKFNPRVDWFRTQLYTSLQNPKYLMVVAEDKGEIIGFVNGIIVEEPSLGARIGKGGSIYVDEKYRKTSVSVRLYKEVVRFAKEKKLDYISVSPKPNTDIYNMYLKRDFEPTEITMLKKVRDMEVTL